MASSIEQTTALDQFPDLALDDFPLSLQRVPLSEIGMDGLTDPMISNLAPSPFTEQTRAPNPWVKL